MLVPGKRRLRQIEERGAVVLQGFGRKRLKGVTEFLVCLVKEGTGGTESLFLASDFLG